MTCRIGSSKARFLSPMRRATYHQSMSFCCRRMRSSSEPRTPTPPYTDTIDICSCTRQPAEGTLAGPGFTDYTA